MLIDVPTDPVQSWHSSGVQISDEIRVRAPVGYAIGRPDSMMNAVTPIDLVQYPVPVVLLLYYNVVPCTCSTLLL